MIRGYAMCNPLVKLNMYVRGSTGEQSANGAGIIIRAIEFIRQDSTAAAPYAVGWGGAMQRQLVASGPNLRLDHCAASRPSRPRPPLDAEALVGVYPI